MMVRDPDPMIAPFPGIRALHGPGVRPHRTSADSPEAPENHPISITDSDIRV